MEDQKKNPAKPNKCKQGVKTEWGAQYVVFTYFQGDINSVVDEHFSRALSSTKTPQDLSRKTGGEEAAIKSESPVSPHQWNFSSPWGKLDPASSPLNFCSSDSSPARQTADPYHPSVLQNVATPATELWHLPEGAHPNWTAASGYPPSMTDLHMTQGSGPDGKYGSLLGLLQHERSPPPTQEPPDSAPACYSSSTRLENMSQTLTSGGGIPASDRRDFYF
uniref:Vestigial like family member 1 n=1 Tax=Salvator merianae TaxID=96440 RepID=A0A8D0BQ87_SALMN